MPHLYCNLHAVPIFRLYCCNCYISSDAKSGYRIGKSPNAATSISVIIAAVSLVLYQMKENSKRAAGGRNYRFEQSADQVASLGHLHPDFRYVH